MTFIDLNPALGIFVLRLAIGIIFLAHGPSKLTNTKKEAAGMGMDPNLVMLVGALEVFGAISLILGLWVQLGALCLIAVMLGAIYFKTQKWGKSFTGPGGWELDFLLVAGALAVLLTAGGSYSLLG